MKDEAFRSLKRYSEEQKAESELRFKLYEYDDSKVEN